MSIYAVCYVECEECGDADELFSTFQAAMTGNYIQVNYDKAVDEAKASGYRFIDGRWICPFCYEETLDRRYNGEPA